MDSLAVLRITLIINGRCDKIREMLFRQVQRVRCVSVRNSQSRTQNTGLRRSDRRKSPTGPEGVLEFDFCHITLSVDIAEIKAGREVLGSIGQSRRRALFKGIGVVGVRLEFVAQRF